MYSNGHLPASNSRLFTDVLERFESKVSDQQQIQQVLITAEFPVVDLLSRAWLRAEFLGIFYVR